jgi:hypothetical protein
MLALSAARHHHSVALANPKVTPSGSRIVPMVAKVLKVSFGRTHEVRRLKANGLSLLIYNPGVDGIELALTTHRSNALQLATGTTSANLFRFANHFHSPSFA